MLSLAKRIKMQSLSPKPAGLDPPIFLQADSKLDASLKVVQKLAAKALI
jgi:hypothetical protein